MPQLLTIKIVNPKNPDSFLVINQSDFDKNPEKFIAWDKRGKEMTKEDIEAALIKKNQILAAEAEKKAKAEAIEKAEIKAAEEIAAAEKKAYDEKLAAEEKAKKDAGEEAKKAEKTKKDIKEKSEKTE